MRQQRPAPFCPLLAVSNSVVNALALGMASAFVLLGSNITIAAIRRWIPEFARLPSFVLVIATFTTCAMLLMQAYAFELYLRIALFVQIIVTNCMILGRIEAFASRQPVGRAFYDAAGTACGFALALLAMGAVRELVGQGSVMAGMEQLIPGSQSWRLNLSEDGRGLLLASLPPGAFIIAGLLLGAGNALVRRPSPATTGSAGENSA